MYFIDRITSALDWQHRTKVCVKRYTNAKKSIPANSWVKRVFAFRLQSISVYHVQRYSYNSIINKLSTCRRLATVISICLQFTTDTVWSCDRRIEFAYEMKQTLAVFIDLSSAFDDFNYYFLVLTFHNGIKDPALNWFSSYLTDHMQYVDYDPVLLKTNLPPTLSMFTLRLSNWPSLPHCKLLHMSNDTLC